MKLIASMWTIPVALCLPGAAFADELTTSGDATSLGFSATQRAIAQGVNAKSRHSQSGSRSIAG
jgi:hypothetical protein